MSDDPLIIAVVSGKGGVGKTMLSVAIANELAKARPTLLIDLDFFNRGVTGLMATLRHGHTGCVVQKPSFLRSQEADPKIPDDKADDTEWKVVNIKRDFWFLDYPDLTESEIRKFETIDVGALTTALSEFATSAMKAAGCDCVVLDCHGGPDNSSFAACLIAHRSLLVSEPDRITLFGTLNFLRQLWSVSGDRKAELHMVFNKVVPAFSSAFLTRFYDRYLKAEFGGRPLLATYPLEVYLTKEFERTPFLTDVYPTSLLARKTRILLRDLLSGSANGYLTPRIRNLWAVTRHFYRNSLGKSAFLFDTNFIMPTVVAGVIFAAAVFFLQSKARDMGFLGSEFSEMEGSNSFLSGLGQGALAFVDRLADMMDHNIEQLIGLSAGWFLSALFLSGYRRLDMKFTYYFRRHYFGSAVLMWLELVALWFFPILLYGLAIGEFKSVLYDGSDVLDSWNILVLMTVVIGSIITVRVVGEYLCRSYGDLKYESRYFESFLRVCFVLYVVGVSAYSNTLGG